MTAISSDIPAGPGAHGEPTRRDFLLVATAALGTIGATTTIWPMIDQMNPDAATLAQGAPVDVDLTKIEPGQQIILLWRSNPIFVMHRTDAALKELQSKALTDRLRDPNSTERQQPKYADNWHRSINPEFLVLIGICTHFGCIPEFRPQPVQSTDWPGGYYCPCHGSKYDLAGRVFQGVPAPFNLPVPPYHFPDKNTLRVGENPAGQSFTMTEILQM